MKFRWLIWMLLFLVLGLTRVFSQTIPQRIISLSPNITEMIYDLGVQDRLVGDTDFCKYPPEADKKEKIGGWIDPNFEKIVSLKPDLVLAQAFHEKAIPTLRKLHVPVVVLHCDSVQEILETYDQLGKMLGCEKQAQAARRSLEKRLATVKKRGQGQKPLSVLFVVDRTAGTLSQIYGVGPKNFVDELIHMAGGVNVLHDAKAGYPLVSKEELIQRDPDVIIDAVLSHGDPNARPPKDWSQLPTLKAVRQGHVYFFTNGDFLIPGPSMVKLGEFLSDTFAKVRADHE
jgi:iron complex transport system substrate-binding protein